MNAQSTRGIGSILGKTRIEAFSDGVFAVAITLLVLNLQVPQLAASVVSRELLPKLFELWPKLLIYVLSFVIVGIYWVAHHNTFNYIKRSDRFLLWLNLLLLLCIVFIPFPTALIGQYPEQQISVVIYGGTLVIGCVSFFCKDEFIMHREIWMSQICHAHNCRAVQKNETHPW